jgi:hypothetical protein
MLAGNLPSTAVGPRDSTSSDGFSDWYASLGTVTTDGPSFDF